MRKPVVTENITFDDEAVEVEAGSAVLIPFGAKHAIRKPGSEPLEYISATALPVPAEIKGDSWQPGYERSSAENADSARPPR